MCGIAGLIALGGVSVDFCDVVRMMAELKHRGPDDEGYLLIEPDGTAVREFGGIDTCPELQLDRAEANFDLPASAVLGHRRLAVIDVSAQGHQPMRSADGRFWIVFNGEIYNYVELRALLESQGSHFLSGSDTEVLLEGYAAWGEDVLSRVVGMYAFGIFDCRERSLLLARDHFGIKPLYYTVVHGRFAFASEIKALLQLGGVARQACPPTCFDYLAHGRTDHTSATFFEGIHQLPPAHLMRIGLRSGSVPNAAKYWQPATELNRAVTFEAAAHEVRSRLQQNVKLHARSDVSLGCCLSGGLDSSALLCFLRETLGQESSIQAFSAQFSAEPWCEQEYAELAARRAKADVEWVVPSAEELPERTLRVLHAHDEPFAGVTCIAQDAVFERARSAGVVVMLDGQGADEVFGGYPRFVAARLAMLAARGSALKALRMLRQFGSADGFTVRGLLIEAVRAGSAQVLGGGHVPMVGRGTPQWLNRSWARDFDIGPTSQWTRAHSWSTLVNHDMRDALTRSVIPQLLRFEDRNSMAHSIEARVPYLTPDLAEYSLALPAGYFVTADWGTKAVLRRAVDGAVPTEIVSRRDKVGFRAPQQAWLNECSEWAKEVVAAGRSEGIPMVDQAGAERALLQAEASGDWSDPALWRLIDFTLWVLEYRVSVC